MDTKETLQLLSLVVFTVSVIIACLSLWTTVKIRQETSRPRLWPTDIYLNPYNVGEKDKLAQETQNERQDCPLLVRLRRKTGERDPNVWALLSKKHGASLQIRGQVNFKNGGASAARLLSLEQKGWLEGRPISSQPIAEKIEFLCYPEQEFNADFDFEIPDEKLREGQLLCGIQWKYTDTQGTLFVEEAFFWYDSASDKWWSNMNKVPWFQNISKWDTTRA